MILIICSLGFQADLGGISEEIKHLQDESLSMNIRLKNRRAAEDILNRFLQQSAMDPEMANIIQYGSVNEEFQVAVAALSKKLKYLSQSEAPKDGSSMDVVPKDLHVGKTLLPELEKLKMRAISKIKDYFLQQFGALRKTKTNVSMVQQNSLIKYATLLQFLQTEAAPVAEDLRTVYIESMSRTLFNLFKSYSLQLLKLDEVYADKHDLIGVEEAALRSMFTNKVNLSKRSDAFSLGERDKILDQIESAPILVHVALAESQKYPYEALLRSIVKHLSDAATSEFLFALDFFKKNARDTFNRIFGRTLSLVLENLENYLLTCHDSIGLLLMIKVSHALRMVMQRRRIPVLDSFFDHMSMLFWPRFKVIFDANVKSLKGANPKKLGTVDLTPHYVSRRYAEYVSSILTLQGGSSDSFGIAGGGENMLMMNLKQLRVEMIGLLERLGSQLGGNKEQKVFLINNIDQMLSVFQERRVMSEEVEKLEDMLMHQSELFAEDALHEAFPRLLSFVLQTERSMADAGQNKANFQLDEGVVGALVKEFASTWRTGIQQLNDDILSYFTNFRNGMEILKQVLTQLLLYYTRFQDIIKKAWSRPPPFSKDVVTTSTILQEIKRYSRAF